jgi:Ion channel
MAAIAETSLRLRGSRRYRWVLLCVIAAFLWAAAAPDTHRARGVLVLLQVLTLVVALIVSRSAGLRTRLVLVGIGLILVVLQFSSDSHALDSAAGAVGGLVVLATMTVIARGVVRAGEVNDQSVVGAICVYLLIGILFMYAYGIAAVEGDAPFFAQGTDGTTAIRLYFSFVTLATVGYGDYTPAGDVGHTLANVESLLGQLYLVTVVALLVARLGGRRRPS